MRALIWVLNVTLIIVTILAVFAVGPEIETRLFPVYSKFKLVDATALPDGNTRAVFQFTKFRNCDLQGFAFFNGELGAAFSQVTTRAQGAPELRARPLGTQISSPYVFKEVTPEELATTVFAEIYSHCHALWITRSKVYP